MDWVDLSTVPNPPLGRIPLYSQPDGIDELENVKETLKHMKGEEKMSYV